MTDLGIAIAESTRRGATVTDDEAAALADIQAQYGPLGTVLPRLEGTFASATSSSLKHLSR